MCVSIKALSLLNLPQIALLGSNDREFVTQDFYFFLLARAPTPPASPTYAPGFLARKNNKLVAVVIF